MISRRNVLIATSVLSLFSFPGIPLAKEKNSYLLGSTLIDDIVRDLLGEDVDTRILIAGSACPGHTDLKAADLVFAIHADGLIVHPRQKSQPILTQMVATHPELAKKIYAVDIGGSWLIPATQKEASEAVAKLLCVNQTKAFTKKVEERLRERLTRIDALEKELQSVRNRLKGKAVVSAAMQGDFARWCGLEVVAIFGAADAIDPKTLIQIVKKTRKDKALGVIENLQSGKEAGRPIAEELSIPRVVLSNFPQTDENTPDYFSLVRENVRALLKTFGG